MKLFTERLKHILYRFKTKVFLQSAPARFIWSKLWKNPLAANVNVLYEQKNNILPYFDFAKLEEGVGRQKLKEFTERYADEPDIVYQITGEIIIEPEYGLGIMQGRRFIRQTKSLSHPFLKPALFKYLRHRLFVRKYRDFDTIIHCDGYAGTNLCHFIYDTINPLLLLHATGKVDMTLPVLINEKIYNKPFFQYCRQLGVLRNINWLVQGKNDWIRVKKIYKPFVSMEVFPEVYKLLEGPKAPGRKVFLNRKSFYQRNIKNIKSIEAILSENGFEMVYAEDLSYEQQVHLFREVKYFVGIHGAGLTNLLHSKIEELRVLEIFSESLVHASFYRFLEILQIKYYDAIVGSTFDINWNFEIDEQKFRDKLYKLLSA